MSPRINGVPTSVGPPSTPIRRRSSGCGWLLAALLLGVVIGLALLATATTD